jgi:hypothetical protein
MGILDKLFDKHAIQNTLARELTKPVKSFGTKTHFSRTFYQPKKNHQIDLLYLPEDKSGSKYLCVVTDIGSGLTDARALKTRDGETVLKAIVDIYKKQKYLEQPLRIQVDAGSEFFDTKNYFRSKGVGVRIAATGRHKQQALVEYMNKTIGEAILKLQLNNELVTGETDKNWVTYLPDILKFINDHAKATKKVLPKENDEADVQCEGAECDLLEVGALVRVKLDYPKDIHENRLHGNFRSGDFRWSLKPAKIEKVLLFPNQPIRYVVEGYTRNTFAKWELKPYETPTQMNLTNGLFIVEKLLKRVTEKNQVFFWVRWKGYDEAADSWEPRKKMLAAVPQMVKEFESALKKSEAKL